MKITTSKESPTAEIKVKLGLFIENIKEEYIKNQIADHRMFIQHFPTVLFDEEQRVHIYANLTLQRLEEEGVSFFKDRACTEVREDVNVVEALVDLIGSDWKPSSRGGNWKKPGRHYTPKGVPEAALSTPSMVNNVRMGRGAPSTNHPGNIAFRERCDEIMERYTNASKQHKSYFADKLLKECRRHDVKLLEVAPMQVVPLGWEMSSEGEALLVCKIAAKKAGKGKLIVVQVSQSTDYDNLPPEDSYMESPAPKEDSTAVPGEAPPASSYSFFIVKAKGDTIVRVRGVRTGDRLRSYFYSWSISQRGDVSESRSVCSDPVRVGEDGRIDGEPIGREGQQFFFDVGDDAGAAKVTQTIRDRPAEVKKERVKMKVKGRKEKKSGGNQGRPPVELTKRKLAEKERFVLQVMSYQSLVHRISATLRTLPFERGAISSDADAGAGPGVSLSSTMATSTTTTTTTSTITSTPNNSTRPMGRPVSLTTNSTKASRRAAALCAARRRRQAGGQEQPTSPSRLQPHPLKRANSGSKTSGPKRRQVPVPQVPDRGHFEYYGGPEVMPGYLMAGSVAAQASLLAPPLPPPPTLAIPRTTTEELYKQGIGGFSPLDSWTEISRSLDKPNPLARRSTSKSLSVGSPSRREFMRKASEEDAPLSPARAWSNGSGRAMPRGFSNSSANMEPNSIGDRGTSNSSGDNQFAMDITEAFGVNGSRVNSLHVEGQMVGDNLSMENIDSLFSATEY